MVLEVGMRSFPSRDCLHEIVPEPQSLSIPHVHLSNILLPKLSKSDFLHHCNCLSQHRVKPHIAYLPAVLCHNKPRVSILEPAPLEDLVEALLHYLSLNTALQLLAPLFIGMGKYLSDLEALSAKAARDSEVLIAQLASQFLCGQLFNFFKCIFVLRGQGELLCEKNPRDIIGVH